MLFYEKTQGKTNVVEQETSWGKYAVPLSLKLFLQRETADLLKEHAPADIVVRNVEDVTRVDGRIPPATLVSLISEAQTEANDDNVNAFTWAQGAYGKWAACAFANDAALFTDCNSVAWEAMRSFDETALKNSDDILAAVKKAGADGKLVVRGCIEEERIGIACEEAASQILKGANVRYERRGGAKGAFEIFMEADNAAFLSYAFSAMRDSIAGKDIWLVGHGDWGASYIIGSDGIAVRDADAVCDDLKTELHGILSQNETPAISLFA